MPIIQAPAHEYVALNTAVKSYMHVSEEMGQDNTVITLDQALYYKLVELIWSIPECKVKLIPCLGLHARMNFLKVIRAHMKQCGLLDTCAECILGPGTAE